MGQYFENDDSVKHQIRWLKYSYDKYNFDFASDNGVFAKDGVDYGTKLLIESFIKSGDNGKIFGQISIKQIKSALEEKNYKVDKTQISLDYPITTLGFHEIKINLHKKVVATIKINVVGK